MNIDQEFDFGKYKGLKLREVYQGVNYVDSDLMKAYLKYKLENSDIEFNSSANIKELMLFEISGTLIRATPVHDELIGNWEKAIQNLFAPGSNWFDRHIGNISLDEFNIKIFSIDKPKPFITSGNPEYIEWCIKNVESFFIDIADIKMISELDIYRFKNVDVTYKIDDIYEYKACFFVEKHSFNDQILNSNLEKFNSNNNSANEDFEVDEHDYNNDHRYEQNEIERDYFNAMTDGQLGSYDDFNGSGDDIDNWAGR